MEDNDLVTLNIDGVDVSVPEGTTILEAAKRAGILIPHYCYHPSLPVAGVCRMCLVEVEGAPKLQIGCATTVAEGQVVRVFGDEATQARQSVLEFLLINHPLDCPICDQAGECELQDYVFREGQSNTRYADYPKRYNPVEDFGGDVLYVPNRCILCTRCVRFMDHVAEEPVLNVSERGDRAFIGVHPDQHLDHPWAGNVVDLCPVGSLLSKDSLHKARAWEIDKTPSVCTGCSQGCNVNIDTRNGVVVRLRPRPNDGVNRHFMCDFGRHRYRWMNRGDRIEAPLVRQGDELVAVDWDQAIAEAAHRLDGIGGRGVIIASGNTSNEALYLARQLLTELDVVAAVRVERSGEDVPLAGVPNLALRSERAANVAGATLLGFNDDVGEALSTVPDAAVVLVLDDALPEIDPAAVPGNAQVIYLGTTLPDSARMASMVLPIANIAEEDGTFLNRDRRVQRYFQAKAAPGMARPAWWVLSEIVATVRGSDPAFGAEAVFERLAGDHEAFGGLTYDVLGMHGRALSPVAPAGATA